jgi:L-cysteine desulfidase
MRTQQILSDLNNALIPALGCTDPVSIAYGASLARQANPGTLIESIHVSLNAGLLKNASSVYIPNTGQYGIAYAASLGALINRPDEGMELMRYVTDEHIEQAKIMLEHSIVVVDLDSHETLYIKVELKTELGTSVSIITYEYTHIASVKFEDKIIREDYTDLKKTGNFSPYTINEIIHFAKTVPLEKLNKVQEAIQMNTSFSQQELSLKNLMGVGKRLGQEARGHIWLEILSKTSHASDARMAGSPFPVMSNSGSGNQGLLSLLPIIMMSQNENKDPETLLRACALSSAVMMAIKQKFGILSGMCSAVVSSCGASAGLTYLESQNDELIKLAIQNTIANVSGIQCDGAKTSCALKVSTCTYAALLSSSMAIHHEGVNNLHGFIEEDVDKTIDHLSHLSRISKGESDDTIIKILMKKNEM